MDNDLGDRSWVNMETPCDLKNWRIPEPFRDRVLTLAELDCWVGDFDQGCMDGRRSFLEFVVKCVVSSDEWFKEVKRQEEVRRQEAEVQRQEAARRAEERRQDSRAPHTHAVERYLRQYRLDFEEGFIPREACGTAYCMNDQCLERAAWASWMAEQESADG